MDQLEYLLFATNLKGQMVIGTNKSAQQLIVSQESSITRSSSNQLSPFRNSRTLSARPSFQTRKSSQTRLWWNCLRPSRSSEASAYTSPCWPPSWAKLSTMSGAILEKLPSSEMSLNDSTTKPPCEVWRLEDQRQWSISQTLDGSWSNIDFTYPQPMRPCWCAV